LSRPRAKIPAKPADSRWTDEQWAAIAEEGSHLLVAAAAGSGKTAVLVERIIRRVADPQRPLEMDALLVATFTNAAAAEMKERIRRALEEALEKAPDSRHLERQLALLPQAAITTLHSFCLEVVRRYAPVIGLDPGFRMASETEAELLRMDTLDELFEKTYEQQGENGELARLAELFGGERSDEPLHRLILDLHEFARSHPWPAHWLRQMASQFRMADAASLSGSIWVQTLLGDVRLKLQGALLMLQNGLRLCGEPGGPSPYADTLQEDLAAVGRVLEALETNDWAAWQQAAAGCVFGRLKPCRGDQFDPDLQEQVKSLRDAAKKTLGKLSEDWLARSPERCAEEMRRLAPDMEAIAELVIEFDALYEKAKRSKGLLDFGDLEHYALRILRDPASAPGAEIPSAAAEAYQNRFAEIYLDEYQDTNEVQEAIVSLIARSDPGNVFMVGDVKQSIYRFRLAEPGLFMRKYKTYDLWKKDDPAPAAPEEGLRIDLACNFRSRREILDAVNHVFRLIMREPVGEMNYDSRAELVYGNGYPDVPDGTGAQGSPWDVELLVLDAAQPAEEEAAEIPDAANAEEDQTADETEELEAAQAEARCIAAEIRRLMGDPATGAAPFTVYDGRSCLYRPLQYRDIVILLRATSAQAPVFIEELKAAGIPAYADLATGYFEAVEVDVMLSLLSVIDNPRQDIPLAGVLRSPMVGLSAEELARIRLCNRGGEFWDAVMAAQKDESLPERLRGIVSFFVSRLDKWRDFARREPLADLIWMIYRETGFYDFVGGMPGGMQRQANLRALADRARNFESSSRFRGLFRFLRFLSRMRESGADLGAARALGEGEDVVRILSIHKSKGLEFPVVFAAGLGRSFNRQDLNGAFLMHKTLGFGPRMLEPETRVTYPTLPQLAIRRKLEAEMLAEEMRVLYVALTRPKEKLFLVGTVKDAAKAWDKWRETAMLSGAAGMPDFAAASASCFLDWVGPAAVLAEGRWKCRTMPAASFAVQTAEAVGHASEQAALWDSVLRGERVDVPESAAGARIREILSWRYPYEQAAKLAAKTSITAWKRRLAEQAALAELSYEDETDGGMASRFAEEGVEPAESARDGAAADSAFADSVLTAGNAPVPAAYTFHLRRPRFLSESKLTPAEKGSAYHLVMQHLPLRENMNEEDIGALLDRMEARLLLTPEQRKAVDPAAVAAFCQSSLFNRMCRADRVWREVPFTCGVTAKEAYGALYGAEEDDTVIIQGVVDCLFAEQGSLVLIDYKTDVLKGRKPEEAAEHHRFQVEKYAESAQRILGIPVKEAYVYFFDGGALVPLR
jgi:ATP-dependent helicase/nuclease subunit A